MSTPTVYDVADRAGVSIATVSRVYRTPDSVRAATRDKVLAAARELGYVPSGSARGLASRSTGILGLCIPDYADDDPGAGDAAADADEDADTLYSDQIIRGMERAARRRGYALLVAASRPGAGESPVVRLAGQVDGFAVMSRAVGTADLDLLARRLPAVMLAGPREHDGLDHVVVDNAGGQRELTRHLLHAHGRRRPAFVGGPEDSPDAEARFRGYREALAEAGLPVPDAPDTRGDLTRAAGRAAVRTLADRDGGLPDAVVLANDQMAVGALQELAARGTRVPEDVSVTGFDGIPLGRAVRPSLSTVRQPMRLLGETAVDLLVGRLDGDAGPDLTSPPQSVELPVALALRGSCGCGAG